MPPFRLPFTSKKPIANEVIQGQGVPDENAKPEALGSPYKPSLALDKKEKRQDVNEFKLSSVNDSGEYLPPSPPEKKTSFWGSKSPNLTGNAPHRQCFDENEQFSISRESFESYRRSFDISGRSPITHTDSYTSRTSFDSRISRLPPRSSLSNDTFARPPVPEAEERFEDVRLQDETYKQPKKKSFLSRLHDTDDSPVTNGDGKTHHFSSLLTGRRRGASGSGQELGSVQQPEAQAKVESVVR